MGAVDMHLIESPDSHYLSAAVGWLELGNPAEAKAELARVSEDNRQHPDVLEAKWLIAAELQDWSEGLHVARALIKVAPERLSGWLHQAYALRRVPEGGLQKARAALLPVAAKFPQEATVLYNLACYDCQLGDLALAQSWLEQAINLSGIETIKTMALSDSDLKPLWKQIRKW